MRLAIYDNAGRITKVVTAPEFYAAIQVGVDQQALEVASEVSMLRHYIVDGAVAIRPKLSPNCPKTQLTVGEELFITGLAPGVVIIGSQVYTLDSTEITLSFALRGKYLVRVQSFPFQNWDVTLEVV